MIFLVQGLMVFGCHVDKQCQFWFDEQELFPLMLEYFALSITTGIFISSWSFKIIWDQLVYIHCDFFCS